MLEDTVIYNGLSIKKQFFRAYVYGLKILTGYNSKPEFKEKLVNNWYEYEAALASGEWFSRKEDVPIPIKKKKEKKQKPNIAECDRIEPNIAEQGM